jgi:peptidoglycan/LPS O-acetylase OafA/YrhL/acetyltransferase-like isoleucine patch superfamily enzyme
MNYYGMKGLSTINNFDGIRLLAAVQVFIGHGFLFGFLRPNWVYTTTWFFPGVPIFFGMSGFLLLWSLERHSDWRSYFKNRFLRLYPALWVTMILTGVLLVGFTILSLHDLRNPSFLLYFFGRCTVLFYFVPQIVKPFAQGNPNGSLWTIGVELQFYVLLFSVFRVFRGRRLWVKNLFLLGLGAFSYWIDRHDPALPFDVTRLSGYAQIAISEFRIFYYLFFFIVGMLFYLNYGYLRQALEGKFWGWAVMYAAACGLTIRFCDLASIDRYAPDPLSLLRHVLLMFLVFSAAFTNRGLADRVLRGNDYSYGVYLTHLLMLNSFYQLHRFEGWVNFVLAGVATAVLAGLSWHFIEKPALRWKRRSLLKFVKYTSMKYFIAKAIVRMVQKADLFYARLNVRRLRHELKHLGKNAIIENPASFMNPQHISIGDNFTARAGAKVRAYTSYEEDQYTPVLNIGNGVHLAADVTINCVNRITIGDNSGLGAGSKVMDHAHGLADYSDLDQRLLDRRLSTKGPVTIGRNCYIGAQVVILAGVEIGDNVIVGSNSVVTRSIPANCIAAGTPARVIRDLTEPFIALAR